MSATATPDRATILASMPFSPQITTAILPNLWHQGIAVAPNATRTPLAPMPRSAASYTVQKELSVNQCAT